MIQNSKADGTRRQGRGPELLLASLPAGRRVVGVLFVSWEKPYWIPIRSSAEPCVLEQSFVNCKGSASSFCSRNNDQLHIT
jgi:hypothetical protein